MVIHITDKLLSVVPQNLKVTTALKLLFYLFETNKHRLLLTEKDDLSLYDTATLKQYREYVVKKAVKDALHKEDHNFIIQIYPDKQSLVQLEAFITANVKGATVKVLLDGNRMIVTHNKKNYDIITVDLIDSFVGKPMKILVENINSDSLFINTCLKYVANVDPNSLWKEYSNGGGSTILQVAEHYEGKERVFCIIDGDEVSPGEYNAADKESFKKSIIELCEKYGYHYFILSKREIENYIPDEALVRYGINASKHPYFLMPEECKDYFDMKSGVSETDLAYTIWRKLHETHSEEIAAASYTKTVSTSRFKIPGFGKKVYRAFDHVTCKEELLKRDKSGDLVLLVNQLLSVI